MSWWTEPFLTAYGWSPVDQVTASGPAWGREHKTYRLFTEGYGRAMNQDSSRTSLVLQTIQDTGLV